MQTNRASFPSETPDRSSIWTIPDGWEGTYLLLFVSQVVAWTSLLAWRNACCGDEENIFDVILAVGTGTAAIMITSAGTSMILVECIVIYAEKFLKKRFDEGRVEGLVEGSKSTNKEWREWNKRRIEAEAKGEDAPPPPDSNGTT